MQASAQDLRPLFQQAPPRAAAVSFLTHCARHLAALLMLLFLLPAFALADTIETNDGREFEGTITKETKTEVVISTRFGVVKLKPSEISKITRGKTRKQQFDERYESAKSADDFFAVGQWAKEQKLRTDAKKCMRKAVELDPRHAGAREYLGFILYKDEWMKPEQAEVRRKADELAAMAKKGLVPWEDRWVTPEELDRLERGLKFVDGRWMTPDEVREFEGYLPWERDGETVWLQKRRVLSLRDGVAVAKLLEEDLFSLTNDHAMVAGHPSLVKKKLAEDILGGVATGRGWFFGAYGLEPELIIEGDRVPQFFIWGRSPTRYSNTCEHFAGLTPTVPDSWGQAVKRTHGFVWWDPYCLSSARMWHRPEEDLVGHCYHHWGHLILNRLDYDGRLLPAWYDEGVASLMEFNVHGRNAVFCQTKVSLQLGGGTSAKKVEYQFESKDFRKGGWRKRLAKALEANQVMNFDKLAQKEMPQMTLVDIATSMAILEWIKATGEGDALHRFHSVLRKNAPSVPQRVILKGRERQNAYDTAFRDAVGMNWRTADRSWREWFLKDGKEPARGARKGRKGR